MRIFIYMYAYIHREKREERRERRESWAGLGWAELGWAEGWLDWA